MQLHCPDCGRTIPAADVNVQTGLAKCAACNSIFNVSQRLELQKTAAKDDNEIFPQPPEMQIDEFGMDWRIRWRWFSAGYIGLLFFCIAWDAFLIFWYRMAFTSSSVPWIMVIFPVAHVAVGVGLTYYVLCGFVNSTTIQRSGYDLYVRHAPLPTFGNRRIDIHEIVQLFCERTESSNRNSNSTYSYALLAVLRDGRRIKLLSGKSAGQVRFLEHEMERRLRLKDMPVAGEMTTLV